MGFIGALLGRWIAGELDLPEPFPVTVDGNTFPILWSIIGGALFAALVSLISRRRR